jgi:hypothetical protein
MVVSFIGGENRSIRRKLQTRRKPTTNFITRLQYGHENDPKIQLFDLDFQVIWGSWWYMTHLIIIQLNTKYHKSMSKDKKDKKKLQPGDPHMTWKSRSNNWILGSFSCPYCNLLLIKFGMKMYCHEQCVAYYHDLFVVGLRRVWSFLRILRFSPPIKLTTMIWLRYCWKWR